MQNQRHTALAVHARSRQVLQIPGEVYSHQFEVRRPRQLRRRFLLGRKRLQLFVIQ